ncbi:hypothetical protein [Streptomyces sp. NPDC093970]|uniref:hypothetical protein n=1 Tax=Streptomyces sp. NPDC093970 TaxID=3155076 RepID=UPI0034122CC0
MSNGAGQVPDHRPRTVTAHRIWRVLLRGLTALSAVFLVVTGTAGTSEAAPPGDDLIKVFVVQDPARTGGQPATLRSVAEATLGDPARAGEIFDLNRGLAQRDGGALGSPDDQLRPGWILRLPQDASGPGVRLARDPGAPGGAPAPADDAPRASAPPSSGPTPPPAAGDERTTVLTVPLAAALALFGVVLLALVTAGIVGRRTVVAGFAAAGRGLARLGEPARRRRLLANRRTVARRFATDTVSVRRAYDALGEFAATGREPETPVHALGVDDTGTTVWLSASDSAGAPWTAVDATRWRRPTPAPGATAIPTATATPTPTAGSGTVPLPVPDTACLVRAGADTDGRPVFVDLSRLDGVLSVTGEKPVARDVVRNLLAEIARTRPGTPVTVLRETPGTPPIAVPPGLRQLPHVAPPGVAAPAPARGTVRGAAARRPLRGLVVVAGTPGEREAAELAALCGPGGAGWTGLVCGETRDAHWRWYTDAEGRVDIPMLDLRLTVPA